MSLIVLNEILPMNWQELNIQSVFDYSQTKIFARSLKSNIDYNRIMIVTLKLS